VYTVCIFCGRPLICVKKANPARPTLWRMSTIAVSGAASAAHRIALLSAGFRPFFLLAAVWAALAVPVWLAAYAHGYTLRGSLPAVVWHAHEMVYGFGLAAVTGFLLTAIPNWTGRLPLRGAPLGALVALWIAGRIALFTPAPWIELAFPLALIVVVAREVAAARNFHNLPVVAVLGLFFVGDLLVHLHALDLAYTAALGNRVGVALLLLLIALIGGRIIPSFTRNWLAKTRPAGRMPAAHSALDWGCLFLGLCGLAAWVVAPDSPVSFGLEIAGGLALGLRLARWCGLVTVREPLLFVLHAGYGWLASGLAFAGANGFFGWMPAGAPLHALTVGAIGAMTLAVMTRASLGHTGRVLTAGAGTVAIYILVSLAAVLRVSAQTPTMTSLAGLAWSAAFALFAILYGPLLVGTRR
jgi:uncharacterized protein involved in response to NO